MGAELILALIEVGGKLAQQWIGRAKFADGTLLTQEHVDAAKKKADAPWQSIEETAAAELAKLPPKTT